MAISSSSCRSNNIVVGLDARTARGCAQQARAATASSPIRPRARRQRMVIAGSTANGYGGGYISGHDAKNGEELWRKR